MACARFDKKFSNKFRILKNGAKYPGKHNQSTVRTSPNLKPLQPKAQYLIIWKALINYLEENIRAGKSVYVKKFGTFSFNVQTELPKIASRNTSPSVDFKTHVLERKNVHHLKPVFIVDDSVKYHLIRYKYWAKEEISPATSQHSIYQ